MNTANEVEIRLPSERDLFWILHKISTDESLSGFYQALVQTAGTRVTASAMAELLSKAVESIPRDSPLLRALVCTSIVPEVIETLAPDRNFAQNVGDIFHVKKIR